MEVMPSPLYFDPLMEFLNDSTIQNLVEVETTCHTEIVPEVNTFNSGSTLSSDSIIDFDLYEDQDIDLDVLLNQDLDLDDFSHINTEDNRSNINLRINFKKTRKSKQKSILPISMRDVDDIHQLNNKSNLKNEDLIQGKPGDRIYLSKEERELLIRDGFMIPTHFPLTKSEERALKSIRRKIRNKISAKNSRAKKETYIEGLEQRIFICTKENSMLQMKLAETEKDKMSLYQQVISLQSQLARFLPNTSTSSTSLMLLLLTFMVILTPMFDPRRLLTSYNINDESNNGKNIFPGRTRMLLEKSTELGEPYMVTIRPSPIWQMPPKTPAILSIKSMKSSEYQIQSSNVSPQVVNTTASVNLIKDL